MESFTEIVKTWGRADMAKDLGVTEERVRNWERLDSIPDDFFRRLLDKAPKRNIRISPDLLIDLAARN
ncbi:hypothetical protein LCGC14_3073010 [marine sediment metagenome]|uniref:HTH cro/C1-type domain-containing protein n=1 Tax=marine sediment metagenome TaxID=412755 RepID=A0A0F8WG79_9ZZZZ